MREKRESQTKVEEREMACSAIKDVNMYTRKYSKGQMQDMCRTRKLDIQGKKFDLAKRLVANDQGVEESLLFRRNHARVSWKDKVSRPVVKIQKNTFGHFEHQETGLVFHQETQQVMGTQQVDGSIQPLSCMDIEFCKKYKFPYTLPLTLDNGTTIYEILENSDREEDPDLEKEQDSVTPDDESIVSSIEDPCIDSLDMDL